MLQYHTASSLNAYCFLMQRAGESPLKPGHMDKRVPTEVSLFISQSFSLFTGQAGKFGHIDKNFFFLKCCYM